MLLLGHLLVLRKLLVAMLWLHHRSSLVWMHQWHSHEALRSLHHSVLHLLDGL